MNSGYNRLLATKNDFATLLAGIEEDQQTIKQQINELNNDLSTLEWNCEQWQEAINEILRIHLIGNIGQIFDQMRNDKQEALTEVRNVTNRSQREFDNQERAQEFANTVSRQIQELLGKKLENIMSRIESTISEVKNRLAIATKEKLKPDEIWLIIRTRLNQELNIDISLDVPQFDPSIPDAKEFEIGKVNTVLNIWGKLHNTFIAPLNNLKAINIPVVETKYCINYDEYISRIDDLVEKTQSSFEQELRFIEEKIRNEANQYAKNVADQIRTCQNNLKEAMNVKASDATKYKSLKEDFFFLNQRSSQLIEEIDSLRQVNKKLL